MGLYKKSGVDVEKAESLVEKLKEKYPSIGGYAGVYEIDGVGLAATCDGVGTKIKLAVSAGKHRGIGIDLVAMSVNDLIAGGARPLFFLDYFACGKLREDIFSQVMEGIREATEKAGCLLLGGETAEMPGMYGGEDYDLAGFAVGKVEQPFDVKKVESGDKILGWSSSGVHSNGFSLIRDVFSDKELKEHSDMLLSPTVIYDNLINPRFELKNLAHVTGGGMERALKRLLGKKKAEIFDYDIPEIFRIIEKKGVSLEEMKKVFNCGWGMIAVAEPDNAESIARSADAEVIGRVL